MKLETAHKILIGTAIVFFLVFAVFEASQWWSGQGTIALLGAAGGLVAAGLFTLYLRSFVRSLNRF